MLIHFYEDEYYKINDAPIPNQRKNVQKHRQEIPINEQGKLAISKNHCSYFKDADLHPKTARDVDEVLEVSGKEREEDRRTERKM